MRQAAIDTNTPGDERSDEELTDDEFLALMNRQPVLDWERYIHIDPNIAFGKPVIRGTRIAAEFVLDLYALGWTEEQILENYSHVSREALRAIFAYAADCVAEKQQRPPLIGGTA